MITVTLHDSGGTSLISLLARESDGARETPVKNLEGVQPPGATVQGVFGDGTLHIGALERDFALCNVSSYSTLWHAKSALDTALASTVSIRVDGWSLPLAGVPGVVEWIHMTTGLKARIRFIPSSAYWTLLSDGTTTVTGIL